LKIHFHIFTLSQIIITSLSHFPPYQLSHYHISPHKLKIVTNFFLNILQAPLLVVAPGRDWLFGPPHHHHPRKRTNEAVRQESWRQEAIVFFSHVDEVAGPANTSKRGGIRMKHSYYTLEKRLF
jgi:hypothetical protein